MNVMPTMECLNEIVLGWGFCLGLGGHCICLSLYSRRYRREFDAKRHRDEILARPVIPLFQNYANITLFEYDNATSHIAGNTVNFLRANTIASINNWPDLNPNEHLWDNLDQRVRCCPILQSNVIQPRQALIQE